MKSISKIIALTLFAVAMTVTAQKDSPSGGTNDVTQTGGAVTNDIGQVDTGSTNAPAFTAPRPRVGGMMPAGEQRTVSDGEIASSLAVVSVTTNATVDYRMPVAADYGSRWHLRGAYEDEARIGFGTWRFPWGSNDLASVWAQTFGTVSPTPKDRERMIRAVGAPMSAVPGESRLWTLQTNDAFLITWENFILGRQLKTAAEPAPRVNAQIELRRNGWVVTRSNRVETVYRRVDPDDWDGDGLPNAADEWPCRNDGDFFGPRQTLPATADTNNYYWIDLVVHGVDALVTFTGDRASDLPDPVFMARAEVTNRVTLLIGKRYVVTCTRPLEILARECADVEVTARADWTVIRWPLVFTTIQVPLGDETPAGGGDGPHLMSAGRQGTSIERTPSRTTGRYEWDGNYCCVTMVPILNSPLFVCDDHCGCGGCSTGQITYSSEGASFSLEFPIYCACPAGEVVGPAMPSAGGVAVAFSKPAVIFENDYTNSADAVVGRRSTRVELQCALNGGENGGDYEIGLQDGGRLVRVAGSPLPRTGTLAPHETFRFRIPYEGVMESAATNDIVATASFTDAVTHIQSQNVANLTAVRLVVTPEAYRENLENRHRMGVRERFQISPMPTNVLLDVSLDAGWRVTNTTKGVFYQCPIIAATTGVTVRVSDVPYIPELSVVEPAAVVGRNGWVEIDSEIQVGQAGGIGTSYEVYVLPEDVSFSQISMMEVPTRTSQINGYFTNSICSAIWYHTTERGAGAWQFVNNENLFLRDFPRLGDALPPPWYEGVLDWYIPIGWGEKDASTLEDVVKQLPTVYHQVFTIDSQGGVAVRKFGEWAKRMPDGTVTHSPGLVYEGDGNANP